MGLPPVASLLLAVLVAGCDNSGPARQTPGASQYVPISAAELWSRYRENAVAADSLYAAANLAVTGMVSGIELGDTDRPIVLLQSPIDTLPVRVEGFAEHER